MSNHNNCAIIARFSALGDVVMSIPAIYDAARANPGTNFVVVTRHLPAKAFINSPENVTTFPVDTSQYEGVIGLYKLCKILITRFKPKVFIDLHDSIRTLIMRFWFSLKGVRIVKFHKGRSEKKDFIRHKTNKNLPSTISRYREALTRAGFPCNRNITPFKNLFESEGAPISSLPKEIAELVKKSKLIAIAPFAAHTTKIYPLHLLKIVIDKLASQPNLTILIFGAGNEEAKKISSLSQGISNIINMAEANYGLQTELAIMSHCKVMLSMDSANMHLASLVGCRVVSIWGATHPDCGFLGWNQNQEDVIQINIPCRPCSVHGNKQCRYNSPRCMTEIKPETVISAICK